MSSFFFINAAFLLGLIAVAIPLLIHLFTRRRAKRVEFSTVTFLRDIARRETRRLRVRNVLLLVLRMAAIAALVLAMARPAVRGPLAKGEGASSVVVVLDNSASMAATKDGRTLFSYACEAARGIFAGLSETDEGALLPVCAAGSPSLVSGPARLAGMVGLTDLSNRTARPDGSIALAHSLLQGAKSISKELYVISDFQAAQWEKTRLTFTGPPGDIQKTFVRVGFDSPGPGQNLYICDAEVVPSGSPLKQELEFTVVNSGRLGANAVPVTVFVDRTEQEVRYVDVERSDSMRVRLEIPGRPGEIRVSLPSDALEVDNEYFVAVQVPRKVHVLVLSEEAPRAAQDFIGLALGVSPQFTLRRAKVGQLSEKELGEAQCVVLDNVARLTTRELELLAGFKQSGGRLLLVLGDRVDIRYYNERLLPAVFPARLVGVRVARDRERSFFTLRAVIASHPVLSQFRVSRGEPVSAARFFEAITAEPLEGSTVVAQFSEELPGLIDAEGALLFTSSFDPDWGELATSGAFVPLLHEMLGYLCGIGIGRGPNIHPGDFLEGDIVRQLTTRLPRAPLSVTGPGGASLGGRETSGLSPGRSTSTRGARTDTTARSAAPADTTTLATEHETYTVDRAAGANPRIGPFDEVGVYRLSAGPDELLAFSLNIDPRESDLRYLTGDRLSRVAKGASVVTYDPVAGLGDFERSGIELWPLFALLSLGFLVAELFVARSVSPPE